MRKSACFSTKIGGIDTQLCIREWRRLFPYKTASCVSARYGVPVRPVENWLAGISGPSLKWLGAIFQTEGAAFMVAIMPDPPAYLVEAARQEQIERQREAQRRAADMLARLGAVP